MSYDDDYVASMAAGKLGVLLDTRGELTSALECYEFALERGFDEPGACLSCYIGWLRAYLAEGARSAFEAGLRRIGEDVVQRLGVDTEGLPGDRVAASRSRSPTGATRAGSLARCASRCFGCDERSGGPDRLVTLTLGRG